MKEWIELADGTVVNNAYVVSMDAGIIAIYIRDVHDFMLIYGWFGSSERTRLMTSHQYGDVGEWAGFTTLTSINTNMSDASCVCLRKD